MESVIATQAKKQQGARTDLSPMLAESKPIDTREEIAKKADVSHGTLDKVKTIQEKASPEQIAEVRTGNKSINEVYKHNSELEVLDLLKNKVSEYIVSCL